MKDRCMEDNSGSLSWFVAGLAIGAAAGMLYAPQAGRVTRRKISRTATDSRDAVEHSGKELMERGKELYDRGKKIADDAADLFERGRKLVQS
jgi:gas vesicle protein